MTGLRKTIFLSATKLLPVGHVLYRRWEKHLKVFEKAVYKDDIRAAKVMEQTLAASARKKARY